MDLNTFFTRNNGEIFYFLVAAFQNCSTVSATIVLTWDKREEERSRQEVRRKAKSKVGGLSIELF